MRLHSLIVWATLFLIGVSGPVACIPMRGPMNSGDGLATVKDIRVNALLDKTEITVVADKPIIYTSYELTQPPRLIVDLAGTSLGAFKTALAVDQGAVVEIRPVEGKKPSYVSRLEIQLSESVSNQIHALGSSLVIGIDHPVGKVSVDKTEEPPMAEPAPSPAPAPPPIPVAEEKIVLPPPVEPAEPPAKTVEKLTYALKPGEVAVTLSADGRLEPEAFMVPGNRLVVDLPNVTSRIRPNLVQVKSPLLKRIRIGQHLTPKKVRVVFDLTKKVDFTVRPMGETLMVTMVEAPLPTQTAPESPEKPAPAPAKEKAAPSPPAPAAPLTPTAKPKPSPAPAVPAARPSAPPQGEPEKRYTGRRISLDFQDAEISNVLRLLADVSGFNIVIGEDVQGKVTLKLINVPWDQAMDIVLKMKNLGKVQEGNIIRVATVATITRQQDDEARAKETKIKAEDLITRVIYVNYARAEDLADPLKKNLSPRGDINIDKRTNTMIVKDIKNNLDEIVTLVKTLDTRTPQVQIEARIVQADTSFARSLGIQWGVGFSAVKSNNIGSIQGINTGATSQPAFGAVAPDFAVNLPGSVQGLNAVPSLGFSFGRFTENPINLDLRISAGELNGLTKTISSPKITTLDNVKAKIEQGESIPFPTTSLQGTQTTFVDANLTLEVTPHITSDQSIIMKVKAARNALGTFSGPAGPSISKREASTEVLVKDGETTVIGGIFVDETQDTETGVPFLSKIPILGWLFKSETKTDTKNELLIFLTPRIITD